jgi:hypothetical protein
LDSFLIRYRALLTLSGLHPAKVGAVLRRLLGFKLLIKFWEDRQLFRAKYYCSTVQIEIDRPPTLQAFCHCNSCRVWSGQPVSSCVVFSAKVVHFVAGEDQLRRFSKPGVSHIERLSCRNCGGTIGTFVPSLGIYDIFAGVIRDFVFNPEMHLNYQERVLSIRDGLPKMRDFPTAFGGTGELVDE